MKKIILLLLCISFFSRVYAAEDYDVTDNVKVMYKWYKEEKVSGMYYPKKDKLEDYYEDITDIIYDNYTVWDDKYCQYSSKNYYIEYQDRRTYKMVEDTRYIKILNVSKLDGDNIKVFFKNQSISFEIIGLDDSNMIIDLKRSYETSKLWFYINVNTNYEIILSNYENFIFQTLYKKVTSGKVLIPDSTWITTKTHYITYTTTENKDEDDFTSLIQAITVCRLSEIKTYRYKINKIYYDENYYEYVEGYLPDIENYQIIYTGEIPTNIITNEITKTIKDIQKEYVYLDSGQGDNTLIDEEDSKSIINNLQNDNVKEEIIEKEVVKEMIKIPKIIYIFICVLILIIIILIIRLCKKSR